MLSRGLELPYQWRCSIVSLASLSVDFDTLVAFRSARMTAQHAEVRPSLQASILLGKAGQQAVLHEDELIFSLVQYLEGDK